MTKESATIDLVKDVQKTIDDTIVLLVELGSQRGLTGRQKAKIKRLIEALQVSNRDIPEIARRRGSVKKLFGVIEKAIELWKDLFNGS